jgi:hypothetical protein
MTAVYGRTRELLEIIVLACFTAKRDGNAHVEKQAEEMVAAGTPQQDILRWLQGLRETVSERLAPYPGPGH